MLQARVRAGAGERVAGPECLPSGEGHGQAELLRSIDLYVVVSFSRSSWWMPASCANACRADDCPCSAEGVAGQPLDQPPTKADLGARSMPVSNASRSSRIGEP